MTYIKEKNEMEIKAKHQISTIYNDIFLPSQILGDNYIGGGDKGITKVSFDKSPGECLFKGTATLNTLDTKPYDIEGMINMYQCILMKFIGRCYQFDSNIDITPRPVFVYSRHNIDTNTTSTDNQTCVIWFGNRDTNTLHILPSESHKFYFINTGDILLTDIVDGRFPFKSDIWKHYQFMEICKLWCEYMRMLDPKDLSLFDIDSDDIVSMVLQNNSKLG